MSDSYHQTLKSTFGGKSVREIDEMFENEAPECLQYLEKRLIKAQVKENRKASKQLKKIESLKDI
jgi:hypothetical protein